MRVWPRGQMSRLCRLSFGQLGIRTDTLNTPRICAALNPSICVTWNAGHTRTLYVYTILRGCDHERVDYPGPRWRQLCQLPAISRLSTSIQPSSLDCAYKAAELLRVDIDDYLDTLWTSKGFRLTVIVAVVTIDDEMIFSEIKNVHS